jgi:AICAR transformylase/IMP cyclohydrolase PurH
MRSSRSPAASPYWLYAAAAERTGPRVDAARQAVDKARAISGPDVLQGAACASDAFYPFADAVEGTHDAAA